MSHAVGCIFCCNATELRSLLLPYDQKGKTEVYAEIVERCFCIQLLTEEEDPDKNKYMICEGCIARLRDVLRFRIQVEEAKDSIQKQITHRIKSEDDLWSEQLNPVKLEVEVEEDILEDDSFSDQYYPSYDVEQSEQSDTVDSRSVEINDSVFKSVNKKTKISKKVSEKEESELDINNLKCEICNEVFVSFQMFKIHKSVHFPNHVCQVCGKAFRTKPGITNHLKTHDDKEVNCEICNKVYGNIIKLNNHKRTHKNKDTYCCPHCPERFSRYMHRVNHLASVHNEELKKYKCTHCPKMFRLSYQLTGHVKRVHFSIRKFQCEICDMSFGLSKDLLNHTNSHYNIRNHQCDVCKKSFVSRSNLRQHVKIHSDIKEFVCHICNRAFNYKCSLKSHIKLHEEAQETVPINSEAIFP